MEYEFTNLKPERLKDFKEMNNIRYEEEGHSYFKDGELIHSVSKILQEAGISPDYSMVDPELLEKAQRRGTAIHMQVEEALRDGDLNEVEDEALQIVEYIKREALENCILTEEQVYSLNSPIPYGGRFDVLIENRKGEVVMYDIKTYKGWGGAKAENVSWQLSLYANAFEEMQVGKIDKLAVLIFDYANKPRVRCVEIKRKNKKQIEELLERGKLETAICPIADKDIQIFKAILQKEEELKQLENSIKDVKEHIYKYMLEKDIIKAESLDRSLSITLVKPIPSQSVDSKVLKEQYPEIYEKVLKTTERKGYIRINNKKEC